MKYYSMRTFLLAVAFALLPLYESSAASVDDILGRTHLEIAPAFSYRLAYEDNVDWDRSGKDRINDWSNHYKPGVDITVFGPRYSFSSHVDLDVAEYIDEKNFNYVDQFYSVSLGYLPTDRLEFSLGAGYTVDTDSTMYEDIGDIDPTDEYAREKDKTTDFFGGFSYSLTPRSTIGLTGTFAQYDSEATNGSEFYSLVGIYTYSLSPRTNLLLNLGYFYYDFDGNYSALDPDDLNYEYSNYSYEMNTYNILAGFEHMFENDGKLLAQLGMRFSDTDSSQLTDTGTVSTSGDGNGWVGVLEYQKRFNAFLFGFEATQDVTVSPEGANYESTRLTSRTTYTINPRLDAGLEFSIMRAYADGDEFIGSDRDTRAYIVRPNLSYKAYRWLKATLAYQYRYTEEKDRSDAKYHSNLFYIDLKFIPLRNLVLR